MATSGCELDEHFRLLSEVEVVKAIFQIQEVLHEIDRRRMTAEVETSTITSIVGDLNLMGKSLTSNQKLSEFLQTAIFVARIAT